MKLPIICAALALMTFALAQARREPQTMELPVNEIAPPLDWYMPAISVNCDTYRIDYWAQRRAVQRCAGKV